MLEISMFWGSSDLWVTDKSVRSLFNWSWIQDFSSYNSLFYFWLPSVFPALSFESATLRRSLLFFRFSRFSFSFCSSNWALWILNTFVSACHLELSEFRASYFFLASAYSFNFCCFLSNLRLKSYSSSMFLLSSLVLSQLSSKMDGSSSSLSCSAM